MPASSSPVFHPAHLPIKRIAVVGCGGNGSIFITHLSRIYQAWVKLGGPPFEIDLYDPDRVTESNLARQVFCDADIGQFKAEVLAMRMETFFGIRAKPNATAFTADPKYPYQYDGYRHDVIVGCVDTLASRRIIEKRCLPSAAAIKKWEKYAAEQPGDVDDEDIPAMPAPSYWLDLGNTDRTGQVVLGGHGLPNLFELLPHLRTAKDALNLPSCSMAESLSRQDLFINSTVATLAANLLWQLMRHGRIEHHGYFINLQSGRVAPIPVPCQNQILTK